VTFAIAALLVALLAYLAYAGFVGSGQLVAAPNPSTACGTPADLGLDFEAIGYDAAADAELAAFPDHDACPRQGPDAADTLRTTDGARLAGWYVPATSGAGPTAPTVVLLHGWGSNKSNMLGHVGLLAPSYNVVAFDMRHHGQSSAELPTTQGVTEQRDLETVLDWLDAHKGPSRIAVLGVSMGGATAVAEARADERVAALVLDSTHPTLQAAVEARFERAGYPLALPVSWGILMGGLLRTGIDMTSVDPDRGLSRLGERPVLVLVGGQDRSIGDDPGGRLVARATEEGVPVTVETCPAAGHAGLLEACPDDYAAWVLGFLDSALGG
jgi:pimeloyl-ACP methyl ester carboxylesterase